MSHWLAFAIYVFITAITPGPNNLLSLTESAKKGFRQALPLNFGILAGFSIVMLICTVLTATVSEWIPVLMTPMQILGALYILWLAWQTFRSSSGDWESGSERKGSDSAFWTGFLLQFVNAKIYIYGIMSMQAYVLPHFSGQYLILSAFAFFLAFVGFVCTLLWSAFGSVFRYLFSMHAKFFNTILALLLVYCAVLLLPIGG